jgi:hypothetical protein
MHRSPDITVGGMTSASGIVAPQIVVHAPW